LKYWDFPCESPNPGVALLTANALFHIPTGH
jgi:hypothetical protein